MNRKKFINLPMEQRRKILNKQAEEFAKRHPDYKSSLNGKGTMEQSRLELLTVSEAARMLRVHPNTLRQWTICNKLPAYRIGTRRDRRFKMSDIMAMLKKEEG